MKLNESRRQKIKFTRSLGTRNEKNDFPNCRGCRLVTSIRQSRKYNARRFEGKRTISTRFHSFDDYSRGPRLRNTDKTIKRSRNGLGFTSTWFLITSSQKIVDVLTQDRPCMGTQFRYDGRARVPQSWRLNKGFPVMLTRRRRGNIRMDSRRRWRTKGEPLAIYSSHWMYMLGEHCALMAPEYNSAKCFLLNFKEISGISSVFPSYNVSNSARQTHSNATHIGFSIVDLPR